MALFTLIIGVFFAVMVIVSAIIDDGDFKWVFIIAGVSLMLKTLMLYSYSS